MTDDSRPGAQPSHTLLQVCQRFVDNVRHSSELGIVVTAASEQQVVGEMPWQSRLVGNPDTGVLHGGAVFAFLDQLGGLAVAGRIYPAMEITPTIDFRLDHLHAPASGSTVIGVAECYRFSEHVAFVRLSAHQAGSEDEPLASGLATYMRMKIPFQGQGSRKS